MLRDAHQGPTRRTTPIPGSSLCLRGAHDAAEAFAERPTLSSLALTPGAGEDGFLATPDLFRMKIPADPPSVWTDVDNMASYIVMKVRVSELKARLSEYLEAVRRGQSVTVLNRKTPVARLVPMAEDSRELRVGVPASAPRAIGEVRGVRPRRPVDVVQLLIESRGDR